MRDVTDILQSYRECVRHLWNANYLNLLPNTQDQWGLRDNFDDACSILFGALVVDRIGLSSAHDAAHLLSPNRRPSPPPLAWLRVVPLADCRAPILINRDITADSGYWDHPVKRVSSQDVELRLVHWFDLTNSTSGTLSTIWFASSPPALRVWRVARLSLKATTLESSWTKKLLRTSEEHKVGRASAAQLGRCS
jgi:hypothetical protein